MYKQIAFELKRGEEQVMQQILQAFLLTCRSPQGSSAIIGTKEETKCYQDTEEFRKGEGYILKGKQKGNEYWSLRFTSFYLQQIQHCS